MYQGRNKTALSSQRQISEAMLALLVTKPYGEISVSEICKAADISRQTFYSLFQSKENVICYELEKNYYFSVQEECGCRPFSLAELSRAYADYIENEKAFIAILVSNEIIDCMKHSICKSFYECDQFLNGREKRDRIFAADFIASGLTSIARNYVLYGPEGDRAFLEKAICRLFGGEIFREASPASGLVSETRFPAAGGKKEADAWHR